MVDTSNSTHNDMVMDSVIPKTEPIPEGSISSSVSTPEAEGEALTQDVAQTQKRKGGRKPIYATSEERKQRNRQAQAAFRERRTEYIRQLETTIKRNEDSLQTLQQNHRSAADECLMLRYKNSLLERILLEKGIDVQAELRLKTGTPSGGPAKPTPMTAKPPSLERAAVNRNSAQRHQAGIAPKGEPFGMSQHREGAYGIPSPQFQATPPSHVSSPSHAKSPGNFAFQGAMSPVGVDPQQQARSQMLSHSRNLSQASPPLGMPQSDSAEPKSTVPGAGRGSRVPSAYYPSPFQKHYDQLEQEYDAQADLIDDDHDTVDPSPYVPGFNAASVPSGSHSIGSHGLSNFNPQAGEGSNGAYGNTNNIMGNYEPMLDADPFGLSASMHFQTPFSYEQNNTRH
ncbi:hypothetical protein ASPWEDRAFT_36971 [Aspergillus wentii DTO 134E9]|uniref:BZIP domain-containing protein n=1 Tax=Aspergillus wentii DTO 134E9 TaxID=1073089 RepID=A0A1L9RWC0_ASPWE|nr:uncharacterized protein ASPWEDRAFT_36971 [Aspergillus wentii DTO 134E9]OJJ39229.1 hypothetical protein ASPWEDRAFT_36971 [Aspergillus wentii DTO 134E9]